MQSAAIICANRGKPELVAELSPTVSLHLMMPYMQSVVTVPVNGMSSEILAESRLTVCPRMLIRAIFINAQKKANAKFAERAWVVLALQSDLDTV